MEKSAENFKISQKFGVSTQTLDKMRVQQCENLHCLKEILKSFYIFYVMKNLVWLLNYVILNFSVWVSP